MLSAHSWVSDVLILFGLIRVIRLRIRVRSFLRPKRIVTPAAASFDEQATEIAVEEGQDRILIAQYSGHEEANEIVVDVQTTALLRVLFRVQEHIGSDDDTADQVAQGTASGDIRVISVENQNSK